MQYRQSIFHIFRFSENTYVAVRICAYPMLAFYRPLLPKHRVLNKGILSELIQPENRKKVSTYTLYNIKNFDNISLAILN